MTRSNTTTSPTSNAERVTYEPVSPRALALQFSLRSTKLAIYADIMAFYHQETKGKMFLKRWQELHGDQVTAADLETRLKRATEGKDAANQYVSLLAPG